MVMEQFTASNGYGIELDNGAGYVRNVAGHERHVFGRYTIEALREFFQHERDEELGRWRWPENKAVVVYPEYEGLHWVVREDTGEALQRNGFYVADPFGTAASDYREAHPERKAWEDAKPGEHWELTAEGGTREYVAILSHGRDGDYVRLFPVSDINAVTLGVKATVIESGRRVWPVSDD